MNRINEYIKSVGGIQQEQWKFYYGPTGIDKVARIEGGIQNLSMDFSTDKSGRILSMNYVETGGYSGELFYTFNSFGKDSPEDYKNKGGDTFTYFWETQWVVIFTCKQKYSFE